MHQVGNQCIVNSWCTVRKTSSFRIKSATTLWDGAAAQIVYTEINSTTFVFYRAKKLKIQWKRRKTCLEFLRPDLFRPQPLSVHVVSMKKLLARYECRSIKYFLYTRKIPVLNAAVCLVSNLRRNTISP